MREENIRPRLSKAQFHFVLQLVPMFQGKGIRIIRLGLHASNDVKRKYAWRRISRRSLGENGLVRILLNKILDNSPGRIYSFINEKPFLSLKGNKRSNITALVKRVTI